MYHTDALQLLLGYLPLDRGLWPSELSKKRSQYQNFKRELLMNPVGEIPSHVIILIFLPVDYCQPCKFEYIPAANFNEF